MVPRSIKIGFIAGSALAVIILAGFLITRGLSAAKPISGVIIKGHEIRVIAATDEKSRTLGLSNRPSLAADEGMLFVFPGYGQPSFWMKDMEFPLDIIWIKDDKVEGTATQLQPEGDSPRDTYQPVSPVNYVLEVNAGLVDKDDIKIGDAVRFEN